MKVCGDLRKKLIAVWTKIHATWRSVEDGVGLLGQTNDMRPSAQSSVSV